MNTANGTTVKQPAAARMTLANVVRGKQAKPIRITIYGVEGCGKSTFAANAPNPIFLCSEDGTSHLDVARFPTPRAWADVLEAIRVLTYDEHEFKTLVIDSVDWLEPLCWAQVCAAGGKADIEAFGFGKGYVAALDTWRTFLSRLELLERSRKMNIVLVAHAQIKKVDDPQTGAFDRYRMKLHEKASDLIREWCDAVLFARYETSVVVDSKTHKARGRYTGDRILHTEWSAAFDAKNRYSLPEVLPLDWSEFEAAVKAGSPAVPAKIRAEIESLIPRLAEAEQSKAREVISTWCGDDPQRLSQMLDKTRAKIAIAEKDAASGES